MAEQKNFLITEEVINIQEVVDKVTDRNAGAVNTFIGTVRELTKGKKTLYLKYDAYVPMAEKKLAQIGDEIQIDFPEAKVAITHRIGELGITDIAVVIAVSTPHRADAFTASRYAIERIKEIVPIWKKEHWEDGEEWIGDQLEKKPYPSGKPEKEDLQ
ncbi:molybdenum cofactor biosynthesis protein MoaE [Evansella sp. LMS18]|jgi:molybdopterin synthase catalytic subunit|uniref:molybdenum cofactor biosynthesis protein MoaE n=1 Tax=Evansella sp. LMS18 TaxID=2924033 RepID=UPI0020D0085A|nr:molybdenum cofactor biosynthesis protein MoaE [Evansella sp. LMS18]UTR11156.1 molybdenum cofactor biosynthesis protein MoaE [Evansella sp. LMS18]